jgi:outer membrane protein
MFPPALTLQYHFDKIGAFKPYVGAGFQWIHYFDSKTGDNKLAQASASFDDSFGAIVQAGVDVELGRGWYANFDVKKSWLDTKVTWVGSPGYSAKVDIDPLIVSAGVGYRFNLSDIFGARTATTASLK